MVETNLEQARIKLTRTKYLLIGIIAALQVADIAITNRQTGLALAAELNPVVLRLMDSYGGAWWLPKALLVLMLILGARRIRTWVFAGVTALYVFVLANNLLYL